MLPAMTSGQPGGWPTSGARKSAAGFLWSFQVRRRPGEEALPEGSGNFVRTEKMARLEAALFVAEDALSARKLANVATLADATEVRTLIKLLNGYFEAGDTAFRIEHVAAGYQMLTRPEFAFWLSKLHRRQTELKLSTPALESLAIVAYRQPVTRAEVESVRGTQSSEILKQLMERGLVQVTGEEETLGRPYLYGTTRKFLEHFGMQNLDDLPMGERLRRAEEVEDVGVAEDGDVSVEADDDVESDDDEGDDVDTVAADDEADDELRECA